MNLAVAIDGQAGSGKDTATEAAFLALLAYFSRQVKIIDSSAMYRAAGLFIEQNVLRLSELPRNPRDFLIQNGRLEEIVDAMKDLTIRHDGTSVECSGHNHAFTVTGNPDSLKSALGDSVSARLGAIDEARPYIEKQVINAAMDGISVVPGRDSYPVLRQIADYVTVLGIYVYADLELRAKRRAHERDMPYEEVLAAMKERDIIDRTREIAPYKVPASIQEARAIGYQIIIHNHRNLTLNQLKQTTVRKLYNHLDAIGLHGAT